MASLTAWLVRMYLIYVRRPRPIFTSAENTRRNLRDLHLRPAAFAPPASLGPGITVERIDSGTWPLYRVSSSSSPAADTAGEQRDAMIYIHGGAFYREIQPQHWMFAAQAAQDTGLDVVVPIYPLLPRPGSTAVEAVAGFTDICRALESGQQQQQHVVAIAGDSAGGTYALATAQRLLAAHPRLAARVRCLVLISPVLDLRLAHPDVVRRSAHDPWLGVEGLRQLLPLLAPGLAGDDPRVSPLYGEVDGLPPVMLLAGTDDMLVADARRLSGRYQGKGTEECVAGSFRSAKLVYIEQAEMLHVYPLLPHREGAEARRAIMHFLNQHTG